MVREGCQPREDLATNIGAGDAFGWWAEDIDSLMERIDNIKEEQPVIRRMSSEEVDLCVEALRKMARSESAYGAKRLQVVTRDDPRYTYHKDRKDRLNDLADWLEQGGSIIPAEDA